MSERQAQHLRDWLDSLESVPVGLDPDVIETVLALRPELARAPKIDLDELIASIEAGPLASNEPKKLAAWLEQGGEAPPSLNKAVKEAVIALKPDLASPPSLGPEELASALPDQGGGLPSSLAPHREEPKPANRWNFALIGTLLAAALVLFIIVPQHSEVQPSHTAVAEKAEVAVERVIEKPSPSQGDLSPEPPQKKSHLAKEKPAQASREGKVAKKRSEPVTKPAPSPAPEVLDADIQGVGSSGFGSAAGGIARRKSESTGSASGSARAATAQPSRDLDDAVRPRAMVIPELRSSSTPAISLDEEEAEESFDEASDGGEIGGVVGGAINPVIAAAESAAVAGRYTEAGEMLLAHIRGPAEIGAPLGLKAAKYFIKAKDSASALKAAKSALALGESSVSGLLRSLVAELESTTSEAG